MPNLVYDDFPRRLRQSGNKSVQSSCVSRATDREVTQKEISVMEFDSRAY